MQSVIIIQLAPNISHVTTYNIDGLHACVYGNSWSGYTKCVHFFQNNTSIRCTSTESGRVTCFPYLRDATGVKLSRDSWAERLNSEPKGEGEAGQWYPSWLKELTLRSSWCQLQAIVSEILIHVLDKLCVCTEQLLPLPWTTAQSSCLAVCRAAIYQPETQLQGILISILKGNSKTLTYLLEKLLPLWEATVVLPFNVSCAVVDTVGLPIVWTESF